VTDTELLDIQNIVKTIKGDAKVGERYMTEKILVLGVDPAIIKQAMEVKDN